MCRITESGYHENMSYAIKLFFLFCVSTLYAATVIPGVDVFFEEKRYETLKEKRIGLIANHTSVSRKMRPTVQLFLDQPGLSLVALFCPEHGFEGQDYAGEEVKDKKWEGLPLHSLHGKTRRPTAEMLQGIDVLIYDIQCVGSRAYTYSTTLFYAMEEAAKRGIEVIVFDRPNPINGTTIDGPMLEEKWRSFIGYINVPYCHGMTTGELARFFNAEYSIGCKLTVIPMKGWKRSMTYRDTGLSWIPPSPNIPEPDTPLYYPSTGLLGELKILNIGVGYTLPFKIVGAPWIDAKDYAAKLNAQKWPGVHFVPFCYKPFYGLYKGQNCQGVLIQATDSARFQPIAVQYLLLGVLKSLYPKEFAARILQSTHLHLFHQANGTDAIYRILTEEKYATWKLLAYHRLERELFREKRKKYLLPEYPSE
jgi:uncharacterized protein YbbC (DUF1343 family)